MKIIGGYDKMKKRTQYSLSNKYWLLFLTLICIVLMLLSSYSENVRGPFKTLANLTVVPMQLGINMAATFLIDMTENYGTMEMLRADIQVLEERIDVLTEQNSQLHFDAFELERLRALFRLDQEYGDYEKIGARVIGMDGANWFNSFTINRGSIHGVREDMNVIADGGLVGIVTHVGPTWSNVRSIIDDASNVSGMVLSTSDRCIVSGDLSLMNEGRLRFDHMEHNENIVEVGDIIVTSYISTLFLQGLKIGYISEINVDANNLTRSGYIIPAVDFRNIQEVLIIMHTKADLTAEADRNNENEGVDEENEEDSNENGNNDENENNNRNEITNGNGNEEASP